MLRCTLCHVEQFTRGRRLQQGLGRASRCGMNAGILGEIGARTSMLC